MTMIPKRRKNKLNQTTINNLKEAGMYFFNDTPAAAIKVSKTGRKSFYGSFSITKGVDEEGRIKSTGRYKYICRVGERPIQEVKEIIVRDIK